jgi:hypothetical protein
MPPFCHAFPLSVKSNCNGDLIWYAQIGNGPPQFERDGRMATVRKRILPRTGDVRWQVDYKDQSGKRRAKQFATKREADAYETKVRGEVAAGVHVADSTSATVAEAVQIWVDTCRADGLQASTVKQSN